MYASSLFALSALPAVFAQYGGDSSGDTTTGASAAATSGSSSTDGVHVVKVGDGGLTMDPDQLTAEVGDVVEFHFYKGAHSVAQSSFADPCQPLNTTGFFSGAIQVEDGVSDEVFRVTIESDSPIWYYCATGQHCQNGMVGSINAATSGQRTLQRYKAAAADAASNVEPSSTGGGELESVASATSTPTSTESSAPNAGLEARGEIRWGLMSLGIAMAGFVGGMMM
ncbi:hypothetical protein ACJ41O_008023 [Fusarium nematophilum]